MSKKCYTNESDGLDNNSFNIFKTDSTTTESPKLSNKRKLFVEINDRPVKKFKSNSSITLDTKMIYVNMNNDEEPNKNNNNKRKHVTSTRTNNKPTKKFKNDEIIEFSTRKNESEDDDDFIDDDDDEDENKNEDNKKSNSVKCPNPLCDHKDFTKEELKRKNNHLVDPPKKIENIDDLIELGKMYQCKKNTMYHGIDLKVLCNLVGPLTELKMLVGMKQVKENITNQIIFFLQGLDKKDKCGSCLECLVGKKCLNDKNADMLHTALTGPPGCGKTELGKILGKIYKAVGLLSKGQFNIASRSDLIGKYLGHTAAKTQAFIDKSLGGVMFIDEAYSLGHKDGRDSFSKECIDTINQNLSENRDFLVIIAGYADDLEKCFFAVNEGLRRRFAFKYDIPEYTSDELMEIFLVKVKKEQWFTEFESKDTDKADVIIEREIKKEKLKQWFKKNKSSFPHFGGSVETLFVNCKIEHAKRVLFKDHQLRKILTLEDVEAGFTTYLKHKKSKKDSDKVPPLMYS